jgi:hypothetical protein
MQSITNGIPGAVATAFADNAFFIVRHSQIADLYLLFESEMASIGLLR